MHQRPPELPNEMIRQMEHQKDEVGRRSRSLRGRRETGAECIPFFKGSGVQATVDEHRMASVALRVESGSREGHSYFMRISMTRKVIAGIATLLAAGAVVSAQGGGRPGACSARC